MPMPAYASSLKQEGGKSICVIPKLFHKVIAKQTSV